MKKDWTYKKFEDCVENVKYTTKIQSKDYKVSGEYPIISQEDELVSGYWDNKEDVFFAPRPLVVFGDHTRVLKYIDFDFVLGADGVKILLPVEDLEAKFLYYFLKWYNVPSLGYSRHYKLLKELSIPIPPLSIQRSIVSELDLLHSLIEKKQEQLRALDNLAQSFFYQMFGDPITNPMGWQVKKLGEVCGKITDGSHNPPKGVNFSTYRMLSSQNIFNGYIDYDAGVRYLSKENYAIEDKRTNLQVGDVLMTIVGTIGRTCIVSSHDTNVTLQRSVAVLRPNNAIISKYLSYFIMSINSVLNREAHGIAQKGIYLKQLSNFTIPLPPLSLQQSFAVKVSAIEEQKRFISQSIKDVESLLAQRMDHYFG